MNVPTTALLDWLWLLLIEMHRPQFGKNRADKNLRFDSQNNSIRIIRYPDGGAPKFPMRLQFKIFSNPVKLKIEFDRVVATGADRNLGATDDGNDRKVSIGRRIDDEPVNAPILQRLAPQIKQGRLNI